MEKTIIKNIGTIVSGDIEQPIIEGTVVVVEDGKIAAIGGEELAADTENAVVIDAKGSR